MSAALTPPTSRADDASLSSAPSHSLPLVSVDSTGEEPQLDSSAVTSSTRDMDAPASQQPAEGSQQPDSQAAVAPGPISEQGSSAHGDSSGADVVMEGTAEPEELNNHHHLQQQQSQQQEQRPDEQSRAEQQQQQEETLERNNTGGTTDGNIPADDDDEDSGDEVDDEASQASSDYEHRFFLENFQEDTSVPTEEEIPEMARRESDEVSALNQEYWAKTSFTQLSSNPDPEYQVLPEIHELKWTMTAFHGTAANPNKDHFTRSPKITVTNQDGKKFLFNLKVFPHGNDGTEMVSAYVECSPDPSQASPETPAGSGGVDESWWELPAQLCCVAYNDSDPRVHASQKAAHQFTSINPDFGWTRFAGPWTELHKRKHLQSRPLLQNDRLSFVLYVRLVNDATRALWYHNVHDHRNDWDPVLKTGYRGYHLEAMPTGYSAVISALAVWLEIPTFRRFLERIQLPDSYACPLESYQTLAMALKKTLHDKLASKSSGASNRITYLDSVYTALVKHGSQTFLNPFQVWNSLLEILRHETKEASSRGDSSGEVDLKAFAGSIKLIEYAIEPNFPICAELEDRMDTEQAESTTHESPSVPLSAQQVIALSADDSAAPDILHLELPRHAYDPDRRKWKKVTTKIDINETVTYAGQKYELFGIITHSGELGNTRFNPVLRPHGPGTQWLRWSTRCNNTTRGYVVAQTHRQAVESHQGSTTSTTVAYVVVYVRQEALKAMLHGAVDRQPHDVFNPLPPLSDQNNVDCPDHFSVAVHMTSAFQRYKSKIGFINPWSNDNGSSLTVEMNKSDSILDLRNRICAMPAYRDKQIVLYRLLMMNSNHRYDPQVREDRLETRVLLQSLHSAYGVHFLLHELSGEHAEEAQKQHQQLAMVYEQDKKRDLEAEAAQIMTAREDAHRELAAAQAGAAENDRVTTPEVVATAAAHTATSVFPDTTPNRTTTPPPPPPAAIPVDEDVVMSGTEEGEDDEPPVVVRATQDAAETPAQAVAPATVTTDDTKEAPPEPKASVQLIDAIKTGGRPCPARLISAKSAAGRDTLRGLLGRHLTPDESSADFAARYANDDAIRFFSLLPSNSESSGPKVGRFVLIAVEPVAYAATWQKPTNHALIFVKHYFPRGPELACTGAMLVPRNSTLKDILKRPNSTSDFVCYLEQIEGPPTEVRKEGSLIDNDIATGCVLVTDPVMEGLMATTLTKRGLPASVIDYLNPRAGFTTGFGRGWAKCMTNCGRAHGEGRVIYPNGDAYEGHFVSGRRQGKGTMFFANGNSYRGNWAEDEPNGVGTIVYASTANKYEGPFRNGRPHGAGGVTSWKKAEAGARICRVCLDEEMNSALVPCGHMVVCMACGEQLRDCPVCRTAIDRLLRVWDCSQT